MSTGGNAEDKSINYPSARKVDNEIARCVF